MIRRIAVIAILAALCGFVGAAAARAFTPWLQMTTPCDGTPSAVAIGGGRIAVACAGDSHPHYRDFP